MINKKETSGHSEEAQRNWQEVRDGIKEACMNLYSGVKGEDQTEDIEVEKKRAQKEFEQKQHKGGVMMFEKDDKVKRKNRVIEDDSSDDEEDCQLVCNMTGMMWESLPFPIIVDSGACASVMPQNWCEHAPIQENQQSRAGEYVRAANGQQIRNHGERRVSMMTKEGTMRDMRFTICDESKALGSVSQMCRTGHRVAFNPPWCPDGSYIENVDTGEVMWLEEINGLYVLNTKVAPTQRQRVTDKGAGRNKDFGRPAAP